MDPISKPEDRLIVRAARPDEIDPVLQLWRESHRSPGKTDDPKSLNALIGHDANALLLAELDGEIVGSLIAAWDGWRGNMYRLTVHPNSQRHGVARRLVAPGEAHLGALGAERVSALVSMEDEAATETWRTLRYEHDPGSGRFVKNLHSRRRATTSRSQSAGAAEER